MTAVLLAHQGGWDEIALIGGPVIVIAALLFLAKRRVDALTAEQPAAPPADDETTDRLDVE